MQESAPLTHHVIFRYSSLGDVVLCSGLVDLIFHKEPQSKIYFVTQKSLESYVNESFPKPAIDSLRVFGLEKKSSPFFWISQGRKLSQQFSESPNPITFYNLQGNLKSVLFYFGFWIQNFVSNKTSLTYKKTPRYTWLRNLSVWFKKDLLPTRWVFRDHAKLYDGKSSFPPRLAFNKSKNNTLVIAPESQHWKKQWPRDSFLKLTEILLKKDSKLHISYVGLGTHVTEQDLHSLQTKFPSRIETYFNNKSLTELSQLVSTSQLCLCGNSGFLHIAEACGTPVVSLSGPIISGFGFSPWRQNSQEFSYDDLSCRPCTKHGGGTCSNPIRLECQTFFTPEFLSQKILSALEIKEHT